MLTIDGKTEMALRLYDNPAYGSTYGKGLYRRAIYNGSIDVKEPHVKYVVDLYNFEDWSNQARTAAQMEVVQSVPKSNDMLYSWINRYDTLTKTKKAVTGVCTLDLQNLDAIVLVGDDEVGVVERWDFTAKPCKQARAGVKAPKLLGTNADLQSW
jgi:hypothetical protein